MLSFELFGISTLYAPFSVSAFCFMGLLLVAALFASLVHRVHRNRVDLILFWIFGITLCLFALFRPVGLALDDPTYIEILSALCPVSECLNGSSIDRDYVWYWLARLGLTYWTGGLDVALFLSALGVFIKLFVIGRLCHERLFALLLLVPLSFIQYDMTQLRAGFASAWMMLGVYFLVRSRMLLGGLVLSLNFMAHSQAIFSPSLLAYKIIELRRYIFPLSTILFLWLIYIRLSPDSSFISSIGLMPHSALYLLEGDSSGSKAFPWGYLPLLIYGIWLWSSAVKEQQKISSIVATSLLIGLMLAWFFAAIPVIQTRLFDFYALPLVLLAGNTGNSRLKRGVTCILAIFLYIRLELFQDWILG